jgi:hypothetical protein
MAVAKRELGRTRLQVTALGDGAMELRGAPRARDITEAQAETILNKVPDAGINYTDTSIDYGLSKERIGRYISHRRAEYYLASKCGCLVRAPPVPTSSARSLLSSRHCLRCPSPSEVHAMSLANPDREYCTVFRLSLQLRSFLAAVHPRSLRSVRMAARTSSTSSCSKLSSGATRKRRLKSHV